MKTRITVVGGGPGGYIAAVRAAQLGADVTLVEKDDVGGTCLHWGCIPSKIMKTTADLLQKFKNAGEFGIDHHGGVSPNINKIMERKNRIVRDQTKAILGLLGHHHVKVINGKGVIRKKGVIDAVQQDGATTEVFWDKLILAIGSKPLNIPFLPFDGQNILSSNDALSLSGIPESILIVGGGVIGCEFACIMSALGVKVTIVEALSRLLPLPSVDAGCSKVLQREMKKRKIQFLLNRTIERVDSTGDKLKAFTGAPSLTGDKERQAPQAIEAENVLVCIGREPDAGDIGLERLGITTDERGWIVTDDYLETSSSGVFAIGDILGPSKIMLAHVASAEGAVAAGNAMGGKTMMNYNKVPSAIFTTPEVAGIGLTETQALEKGYSIKSETSLFRTIGKAHVIGEIEGHATIISDEATGAVLGIHIIGPHATELVAEGTLAIQMGMTVDDLAMTIHAHPTLSEVISETALKTARL